MAGSTDTNPVTQLWKNNTAVSNTPPSAPTALAMTATTNAVMLSWSSASDSQTPSNGLTYNVRAGTTPGGSDLLASYVNASNGFRRVPALGNAYLRHNLPVYGTTNGQKVYWSVQAVDSALAGGAFASETNTVILPQLSVTSSNAGKALLTWKPPTVGWHLQEATGLSPGGWSNSPSGTQNPATLNATNSSKLYRLAYP
jgi:hypothetical protein